MGAYFLIFITALIASWISFYSGFGLGTLLMPILAIFLSVPLAIFMTAIVHFFHNTMKTILLWKSIDWRMALRFGSVAILAAILGAFLLTKLSFLTLLSKFQILGLTFEITLLKILVGLILIFIAILSFFPNKTTPFTNPYLWGALSGFLGGLSGNQGAFRSIFLIQFEKDTKSFIGTNAVIASAIDFVRLIIYTLSFSALFKKAETPLLVSALIGAGVGILLGMGFLKKITLPLLHFIIALLLILLGLLMIFGII